MGKKNPQIIQDPWGPFRFSIIGGLLACPPEQGALKTRLIELAENTWRHPVIKEPVTYSWSTLEEWYYRALHADDPVMVLSRKVRSDYGKFKRMYQYVIDELSKQYTVHPSWSYQLHRDNLAAFIRQQNKGDKPPAYSTVKRYMKYRGWLRKKKQAKNPTPGQKAAYARKESREVRSYESAYVHGLWHLDFHQGSCRVVEADGSWHKPRAFCVLDDRSRVCCHLQWYLSESSETLYHGLSQSFYKRGLPRSLMTDNGAAMTADETCNGLEQLGIIHDLTLPYSPYQNGKQENFWSYLEGRLLKMLENVKTLTLDLLNRASQAWVELEYNKHLHRELDDSPINRMLEGPDKSRSAPDIETLRLAFCRQVNRKQRKSDGTISIKNVRFELPSRFRHLDIITIRYQTWNLSVAYMVDKRTGILLSRLQPIDKIRNARGARRALEETIPDTAEKISQDPIPFLLKEILSDFAATGLPPSYIPLKEDKKGDTNDKSTT